MKKQIGVCILICFLLILPACGKSVDEQQKDFFTMESVYSYDGKYLAVQSTEADQNDGVDYVRIDITDVESNQVVTSFYAERARDFHGICWESDSYNIWIQSGDVGVVGYLFEGETWTRDVNGLMERPADIISKYD